MSEFEFQVGVHDGLIVVLESNLHFYKVAFLRRAPAGAIRDR
jgi:hypothetical protein